MTEGPASVSHAAKHASVNLLIYAGICIILAVGFMAYQTDGFTKPIPSWFSLGVIEAQPALKTY